MTRKHSLFSMGISGAIVCTLAMGSAHAQGNPGATGSRDVVVDSPAGSFRGISDDGIEVFRGVTYAQAPVGALRWRPPVAEPLAGDIVDARDFGPVCYQPEFPAVATNIYHEDLPPMSEDCLSLNIWRPQNAAKVPVFVWIHGGSLLTGASRFSMYDGRRLAERGMMVVSINYRLGALGFMAHPDLSAESAEHVSGNYGLLDQIEALRWIERNIASFGGNPDNVTIAGESAGGLSVMHLLASPSAHGLFDKAVMQSAYMVSEPSLRSARNGHPSAESEGLRLAAALGAGTVEDLRAMGAGELTKRSFAVGFQTYLTVDGKIVPKQIVDTFDEGSQAKVPILAGFNSGETRSLRMLLPKKPANAQLYEQTIRDSYHDMADVFLRIYPASNLDESILQATRDALYGWTAQRLAAKQTEAGSAAYLYLFDHGYRAADKAGLHAFHGSELPYMFGTIWETAANWPKVPRTSAERELSDAMLDYWASFSKSGRPQSALGPLWPAADVDGPWMVFGDEPTVVNDVLSFRYDLVEHVTCRRRVAGEQQWNWNVGLASPPLPGKTNECQ